MSLLQAPGAATSSDLGEVAIQHTQSLKYNHRRCASDARLFVQANIEIKVTTVQEELLKASEDNKMRKKKNSCNVLSRQWLATQNIAFRDGEY